MQKTGIATAIIAIELIGLEVGDRVPTIADLAEKYNLARGTVQTAYKILKENGAIEVRSKGHQGTFITSINQTKILEFSGSNSLVGVMPLPYSKKYEGLATAIYRVLSESGIRSNLAFMRGSNHRLEGLMNGRYDFAVTSQLTAEYYLQKGEYIKVIKNFGRYTYVNEHVILTRNSFDGLFENCTVGIDKSSIDQTMLTLEYFANYCVKYKELIYSNIIDALQKGEIDAAIWNLDDIDVKGSKVSIHSMKDRKVDISDTKAVIICRKEDEKVQKIISAMLDEEKVITYQKSVLENRIPPMY